MTDDAELDELLEFLREMPGVSSVEVGPIKACEVCGHFDCVCAVQAAHAAWCSHRQAVECKVGIACEHGVEVCPVCSPCTCGAGAGVPSGPPYAIRVDPR